MDRDHSTLSSLHPTLSPTGQISSTPLRQVSTCSYITQRIPSTLPAAIRIPNYNYNPIPLHYTHPNTIGTRSYSIHPHSTPGIKPFLPVVLQARFRHPTTPSPGIWKKGNHPSSRHFYSISLLLLNAHPPLAHHPLPPPYIPLRLDPRLPPPHRQNVVLHPRPPGLCEHPRSSPR